MKPRDPLFEREARQAADVSPALATLAHDRAEAGGPNRPEPGRNLFREWIEELADACNYGVWMMQEAMEEESDVDVVMLMTALRGLSHVFDLVARNDESRQRIAVTHPSFGVRRDPAPER